MTKVLIVERDLVLGMAYMRALIVGRFDVERATNESTAAEALTRHLPDVALISLQLPGGKATKLIKWLRSESKFRSVKVIAYSRDEADDAIHDAQLAGANECLVIGKTGIEELLTALRKIIAPPEPAQPAAPAVVEAPKPSAFPALPAAKPASSSTHVPLPELTPEKPVLLETPVPPKAPPKKEEPVGPQRTLAKLKELSQFLLKAENKATQPPLVADLYRKAQEFAASEPATDSGALKKVANSLVVFLKELCDLPQAVTPSSIRTVSQTVIFLEAISKQPPMNDADNPDLFKILVVDDEAVARRVIKGSLGLVQLTPDSAKDPIEALDLARTRRYDLFVLDVNMPVMTGYDLCERLRKSMEYEQTPVIFVTAWNTFESRLRFARSGGDDFIAKPFLPTELAAKTLIHLLGRRMGLSKV